MTTYFEQKVLNSALRGQAFGPISTVYAGLFKTAPTDAGGGQEVSGGGYARKSATFAEPVKETDKSVCRNSDEIDFGAAAADWGKITHAAIFDGQTGGNMLYYEALKSPKLIEEADSLRFAAGSLTISQS
jgi:hypothetical protein